MNVETKRELIVTLLDHWPDFFEPASSGRGTVGAEAGGVALLSSMAAHPSVVELGRCLALCRQTAPGHYAHLRGFYDSEWRIVVRPVRRRNVRGLTITEDARVRERVVPAWVLPRMVERATDFVSGSFRGSPELPLALLAKLRPLADSDGWTEAA